MEPLNEEGFDYLFKIVLVGDTGVGKSCMVYRFKTGTFIEKHNTTIGVDFAMKTVTVDGKRIKLQIWDTAGQERFRTITQSYYRSANGIIVVYDISKISTFHNASRWLDDVKRYAGASVLKVLVGNKNDLDYLREVTEGQGHEFAKQYGFLSFYETSARDNKNIDQIFYLLAKELKRLHCIDVSQPQAYNAIHTVNRKENTRTFPCCR